MEKCPHPRQGQQLVFCTIFFGSAALVLSVCLRYLHRKKSFLPVVLGRMLLCFFPFLEQGSSNRKV